MRHVNYSHLFYFWNVAEAGSIAAASKRLYLTPQTISTQIKLLEEATGTNLLRKSGRQLVLTDEGVTVKQYADGIFSLGAELSDYLRGGDTQSVSELTIGIVETVPKVAVEKLLEPAFDLGTRLVCLEGRLPDLLSDLNQHKLDLVLSDRTLSTAESKGMVIDFLGVSGLALYAPDAISQKLANKLPEALEGAPLIFATDNSPIRRAAEEWFLQHGISPKVVAECSDSGLIKSMAAAGRGIFVAPLNIKAELERATGCKLLIELEGFDERYYAITLDKQRKNTTAEAISEAARTSLSLDRSLHPGYDNY